MAPNASGISQPSGTSRSGADQAAPRPPRPTRPTGIHQNWRTALVLCAAALAAAAIGHGLRWGEPEAEGTEPAELPEARVGAPWEAPLLRPPRDLEPDAFTPRRSRVALRMRGRRRPLRAAGPAGEGAGPAAPAPGGAVRLASAPASGDAALPPPAPAEATPRVALPTWDPAWPWGGPALRVEPDARTRRALAAGAALPALRVGSPGAAGEAAAPARPSERTSVVAKRSPTILAASVAPTRPVAGAAPQRPIAKAPAVTPVARALATAPGARSPLAAPSAKSPLATPSRNASGSAPVVAGPALSARRPAVSPPRGGAPAVEAPPTRVLARSRDLEHLHLHAGRDLRVERKGFLGGSGVVPGSLKVAGAFGPGHSPGRVEVKGDFTLEPDAVLEIELAGSDPDAFDRIVVEGTATLSGVVRVVLLDGFVPALGDQFEVLLAQAIEDAAAVFDLPDLGPDRFLKLSLLTTDAGQSLVLSSMVAVGAAGAAVPEPGTALCLAAGLAGLALCARRAGHMGHTGREGREG